MSLSGFGGLAHEPFSSGAGVTPIAMPSRCGGAKIPMPEHHTIPGGKVYVYQRPNSGLWQRQPILREGPAHQQSRKLRLRAIGNGVNDCRGRP